MFIITKWEEMVINPDPAIGIALGRHHALDGVIQHGLVFAGSPVPDENSTPSAGVECVEHGKLIAPWGVVVRERDAFFCGLRSFDPASHRASK